MKEQLMEMKFSHPEIFTPIFVLSLGLKSDHAKGLHLLSQCW